MFPSPASTTSQAWIPTDTVNLCEGSWGVTDGHQEIFGEVTGGVQTGEDRREALRQVAPDFLSSPARWGRAWTVTPGARGLLAFLGDAGFQPAGGAIPGDGHHLHS